MQYPVNEIFYSLQGEATFAGVPAVFIRLQGCGVGCSFCDTKHTWAIADTRIVTKSEIINKANDNDTFAYFSIEELLLEVSTYGKGRHVVLTGGEPALYDLSKLIVMLENFGHIVQIETSATEELQITNTTWVTVSPKIAMPGQKELDVSAVARANEIKMPIGRIEDITKLEKFLTKYNILNKPIWLQPLSCNKKATEICINAALKNNWRVSLQLHKFIGIR